MHTNPASAANKNDYRRLPAGERLWVADWRDFVVLSFAVDPAVLARHVPYLLDTHGGCGWVSLVWFQLERLRIAGTGRVGELLCRPISEHPFLNVRTYVRHDDGPGICFLAEWIPNRLSARLGPATYGLPYRFGRFTTQRRDVQGTMSLRIDAAGTQMPFGLTVPTPTAPGSTCATGSADAFLLERYQAYMFHPSGARRFLVAHEPWRAVRADWARFELGFLAHEFPWFHQAELRYVHLSHGCKDVEMGRPHRVQLRPERASTQPVPNLQLEGAR